MAFQCPSNKLACSAVPQVEFPAQREEAPAPAQNLNPLRILAAISPK